jgi:hypothetical protein
MPFFGVGLVRADVLKTDEATPSNNQEQQATELLNLEMFQIYSKLPPKL